jgi:hypothetical protein
MIRVVMEEEQLFCARSQGELHGVIGTRMTSAKTLRIFRFVVLRIRDYHFGVEHQIDDLCILQARGDRSEVLRQARHFSISERIAISLRCLPMNTSWLVRASPFSQSRSQSSVKRLFTP